MSQKSLRNLEPDANRDCNLVNLGLRAVDDLGTVDPAATETAEEIGPREPLTPTDKDIVDLGGRRRGSVRISLGKELTQPDDPGRFPNFPIVCARQGGEVRCPGGFPVDPLNAESGMMAPKP